MATCRNLTLSTRSMYRGDTYKFTATFKDSAGDPIDITGYTVKFTARVNYPDKSVVDDSDAAISTTALIPTGTDGVAEFEIIPTQTQELDIRDYFYDIQLKSPSGEVSTIGVGKFILLNEITRG